MSKFGSPLNNFKVASPCPADWTQMFGDERKRFCGDCKLNVYNLSGMSREDAESLIMNAEGRLCVRFYRRSDGTILTKDCPVGWAKVRQRTRAAATAVFSLFIALIGGVFITSLFQRPRSIITDIAKPFVKPTPQYTMGVIVRRDPEKEKEKLPRRTLREVRSLNDLRD